ncbi:MULTISPECIES: DUF5789 family protein [Halorussus]|uniref:DUF5789 family protein n=1 Tax=Halorussus TaxID=1070314 RepID=UPI00209E3DA1|nr:DUF2795 domain-containing protein [Halorussus vallis]USZ77353.1 DUF2795 domain-containing protein [Halorussus vallis]
MENEPDDTGRLRSLEMDKLHELFDPDDFPVTTDEVIEEFGDVEVEYPGGGSERLRGILDTSGHEEYGTTDDLQLAVLNGVERDAVGRPRYSDRDPPVVGEDRNPEQESF